MAVPRHCHPPSPRFIASGMHELRPKILVSASSNWKQITTILCVCASVTIFRSFLVSKLIACGSESCGKWAKSMSTIRNSFVWVEKTQTYARAHTRNLSTQCENKFLVFSTVNLFACDAASDSHAFWRADACDSDWKSKAKFSHVKLRCNRIWMWLLWFMRISTECTVLDREACRTHIFEPSSSSQANLRRKRGLSVSDCRLDGIRYCEGCSAYIWRDRRTVSIDRIPLSHRNIECVGN